MRFLTQLVQLVLGLGIGLLGLEMMREAQVVEAISPLKELLLRLLSVAFPLVWITVIVWLIRPGKNKKFSYLRQIVLLMLQLLVMATILSGCVVTKTVDAYTGLELLLQTQTDQQQGFQNEKKKKEQRAEKSSRQIFLALLLDQISDAYLMGDAVSFTALSMLLLVSMITLLAHGIPIFSCCRVIVFGPRLFFDLRRRVCWLIMSKSDPVGRRKKGSRLKREWKNVTLRQNWVGGN
jgi:Na+/H+-dicarboxylate symporter